MPISYSKKEILQIFLLAVVFAFLFKIVSIYAITWSLPDISGVTAPNFSTAPLYDQIGPVINTGPVDQTKLFANNKGYLGLGNLDISTNTGLFAGNSTLCADADGYIIICE